MSASKNQARLAGWAVALALAASGRAGEISKRWAFEAVVRPEPPAVKRGEWSRGPIDRFILERLEKPGLEPAPEASRLTLIRRLSFDLLGLPPSPEEVDAFVQDDSPGAYERLVERLLSSPRHGERWARHWLDAARYCESHGFEYDKLRPNAWHYRDYVLHSFNDDKPYDEFVKEQLVGDAIEPVTSDGIAATGFLVAGPWDEANNAQANVTLKAVGREDVLEDMVSAVAQTFLGLTVNCARCHDHKFDPIPQEDYYRLRSVLSGVRHGETSLWSPDEARAHEAEKVRLQAAIKSMSQRVAAIDASASGVPGRELLSALSESELSERVQGLRRIAELRGALEAESGKPLAYSGGREQPEPTRLLVRGEVLKPSKELAPAGLSAVSVPRADFGLKPDAPEAERRRGFADWVVDARNPLTARVIANRVWSHHFGQGIVATPNDFGAAGARPSHPELLDWLASELIARGWSLKSLHRAIVTSATYRQASTWNPRGASVDAENQLLWRCSPRRIEAEAVRDAMLFASGEINWMMSGPSFRDFEFIAFPASVYAPIDRDDPDLKRRTIYRMNVQSGKNPLLEAFDCPEPSVKTPRRGITTTPIQALGLMNSTFVNRQAARLATRARKESDGTDAKSIDRAWALVLGRSPTPQEAESAARIARAQGLETVCWTLFNSSELLYAD